MKAKQVEKARLWCLDKSAWNVDLQFNPEAGSLKLSRTIGWESTGNGLDPWGGPLEYSAGEADQLEFSFLLDDGTDESDQDDPFEELWAVLTNTMPSFGSADEPDDVLDQVRELYRLTAPADCSGGGPYQVRPPVVAFVWEKLAFTGAVVNLDVTFLAADEDGKIRRAEVSVSLKGRAFSGSTSLQDFLDATYSPPTASGGSAPSGRSSLLGLLE